MEFSNQKRGILESAVTREKLVRMIARSKLRQGFKVKSIGKLVVVKGRLVRSSIKISQADRTPQPIDPCKGSVVLIL